VPTLDAAACAELMDALTAIAIRASAAIREFHDRDFHGDVMFRAKADGSPVTAADEAADAIIRDGLAELAPAVPVVSEEQPARARPAPGASGSYFLVDPLDGTREFVAGRDDYTVNIAIMTGGAPILGIVTAPAAGVAWRGIVGRGAERIAFSNAMEPLRATAIHTLPRSERDLVIMVSRSHLDARTEAYLGNFAQAKRVQCGSSVKFCRLAEGAADLYPRLAPTHDWDIAAGHAVLGAAGGSVTAPDGTPLVYGSPSLLIPAFIATGSPAKA
jgi:3'(2'), 5'-bisphosphate nucleotidase